MKPTAHGSVVTTPLLLALLYVGPAVWTIALTIAYSSTAVACAHGLGLPTGVQRVSLATALIVALGALALAALTRARIMGDDVQAERSRFLAGFACIVTVASIALIVVSTISLYAIASCHVGHA